MQQLGETREAMARGLMNHLEKVINDPKTQKLDKYYVLVHAKPLPGHSNIINQKLIILSYKPSMMLSCMLFGINNREGKLTLEWALPGDWPTWSVGGSNEPLPEVIASYDRLEKKLKLGAGSSFFEGLGSQVSPPW